MAKIIVTGATGNVGKALLQQLAERADGHTVCAAVRDINEGRRQLAGYVHRFIRMDFHDPGSFADTFAGGDILFLVRPPAISKVDRIFRSLIEAATQAGIQHIVFLSVQGADSNSLVPHHKIEQLIIRSGISYTFLRPAYFMENFTTTLRDDLFTRHRIYLPAGKARFTLICVEDIARVTATILQDVGSHRNQAYDLTNDELLTFGEMADIISTESGRKIFYQSPNPIRFFLAQLNAGVAAMMAMVMIMLHYLPRFRKPPPVSDNVQKITGCKPVSFACFARKHLQWEDVAFR